MLPQILEVNIQAFRWGSVGVTARNVSWGVVANTDCPNPGGSVTNPARLTTFTIDRVKTTKSAFRVEFTTDLPKILYVGKHGRRGS